MSISTTVFIGLPAYHSVFLLALCWTFFECSSWHTVCTFSLQIYLKVTFKYYLDNSYNSHSNKPAVNIKENWTFWCVHRLLLNIFRELREANPKTKQNYRRVLETQMNCNKKRRKGATLKKRAWLGFYPEATVVVVGAAVVVVATVVVVAAVVVVAGAAVACASRVSSNWRSCCCCCEVSPEVVAVVAAVVVVVAFQETEEVRGAVTFRSGNRIFVERMRKFSPHQSWSLSWSWNPNEQHDGGPSPSVGGNTSHNSHTWYNLLWVITVISRIFTHLLFDVLFLIKKNSMYSQD